MIYKHQVRKMESTTPELKKTRVMITALKEGRRKDKAKIRELRQDFQNKDLSFLVHKMKRITMTTRRI